MYKILGYLKRKNIIKWDGLLIEKMDTKEKFITTGIHIWKATQDKLEQCKIVERNDVDINKIRHYMNEYHEELLNLLEN